MFEKVKASSCKVIFFILKLQTEMRINSILFKFKVTAINHRMDSLMV